MAGATDLWELNLFKVSITDDGLANLNGLKKLDTLVLQNVPITNRGLARMAGLGVPAR